jgi:hypothetical protein
MADREEFKFPDEVEAEKAAKETTEKDDFSIEIIDDMPPEDRAHAKPMPKEIVEDLEKDELDQYSDDVKERFRQMKKVWNDERRAKESASREREEALKFAQAQFEENKRLKQRLGVGERVFIQEVTKAANNDLAVAKDKLKQAYESGDAENIASAQEALTDAKLRIKQYENFRPSLQEEEPGVKETYQVPTPQAPAPIVDPKADAWKRNNTWFGVDEEMTALALGLHEKLVRSGIDPRSDDYYRQIDATMRKRFPEEFKDSEETKPQREEAKTTPRSKPSTNVAPVTRATAPRQIRLTATQVALAKRLGLSNEQYARELMKLENQNG